MFSLCSKSLFKLREGKMTLWIQEALAGLSMLVFLASALILALAGQTLLA